MPPLPRNTSLELEARESGFGGKNLTFNLVLVIVSGVVVLTLIAMVIGLCAAKCCAKRKEKRLEKSGRGLSPAGSRGSTVSSHGSTHASVATPRGSSATTLVGPGTPRDAAERRAGNLMARGVAEGRGVGVDRDRDRDRADRSQQKRRPSRSPCVTPPVVMCGLRAGVRNPRSSSDRTQLPTHAYQ